MQQVPNGRSSSNSEMMQAFHMLLKSVTESFSQSQKDSMELQEATLDQIRGMADSIRSILAHAVADPSRADILREVIDTLRVEFEKHDVKCSGRNKEEIGRHQDQMERIIDFKSETASSLFSKLELLIEQYTKDASEEAARAADLVKKERENIATLHTNMASTLERLDGYGKWAIATGSILVVVITGAISTVVWAYFRFESFMQTFHKG